MGGGMRSAPAAAPMRSAPAPARAAPPPAAPMQRAPPPPAAPVPAQPAQMMQAPAAAPKAPGMFAQIASTAAGVAVGSTIGNVASHAILGGGGGQQQAAEPAAAAPQQQQAYAPPQQAAGYGSPASMEQPCAYEMRQFMECTQTQADLSLCQGFNDVLKECKLRFTPAAPGMY